MSLGHAGVTPLKALLAFDTATEQMSLAVERDGRRWEREAPGGAQASARLIPAILALLGEAGLELADLEAIAFGRGPGAFTGLRTACAVAQGLAFGLRKPVLPIDTLLALAEDARAGAPAFEVWALLDARMDEIYAAHYRYAEGAWSTQVAPCLTDPAALSLRWLREPPRAVAGNALPVFAGRLPIGAAIAWPDAAPRAAAMLTLAQASWAAGGAVDAAGALPLYLRDKVAQTTAERDAARAARAAEGAMP
jgi:tRNA threonylcarbamoyladenosine biosynthesis protein TsaB